MVAPIPRVDERNLRIQGKRLERVFMELSGALSSRASAVTAYRSAARNRFGPIVRGIKNATPVDRGALKRKAGIRIGKERGRSGGTPITIRIGYFNLNRNTRQFVGLPQAIKQVYGNGNYVRGLVEAGAPQAIQGMANDLRAVYIGIARRAAGPNRRAL